MKYDSYEIFSGSQKVAIWENGKLTVYNESLLPMYLKRIANADMWLETRAIDSHRANSRLLKKAGNGANVNAHIHVHVRDKRRDGGEKDLLAVRRFHGVHTR